MTTLHRAGVFLWLFALAAAPALAASVAVFTPQGEVKKARQVSVRFSEPMVPFGEPRALDPFDISCPMQGKGRWADARNWVYDFDADPPGGMRCTFTLKPELRTLNGAELEGTRTFTFHTGGPAILASYPREGSTHVDENQVFILALDAPASPGSIEHHVHCQTEGISERIGVRILQGEERAQVLKHRAQYLVDWYRVLYKNRLRGYLGLQARGFDRLPLLLVQCRRTLPASAKLSLVWGAGVVSETGGGIATSQAQALAFQVRPEFSARFSCERVNARAPCIPVLPMTLNFSSPVPVNWLRAITLSDARGRRYQAESADQAQPTQDSVTFKGPFPERTQFQLTLPKALVDDAGRVLANAGSFPLTIKTDADPPLAKFPTRFGIIEWSEAAALPVTLRNIEASLPARALRLTQRDGAKGVPGVLYSVPSESDGQIIAWLKRVNEWGEARYSSDASGEHMIRLGEQSIFGKGFTTRRFAVPKPLGGKAFEVVGIPLRNPGLHIVELASPRLGAALHGEKKPYYAQSAALVTDLAAHLKWGAQSSLVWVTRLQDAKPVDAAQVAVRDCNGALLWEGKTDADGIARISSPLPAVPPYCQHFGSGLFVSARSGAQMTFVLSDWSQGIEPWRFNLPSGSYRGPFIAHTVFDRTLLRAGETVHMKHFFRQHGVDGFMNATPAQTPGTLVISHQGSGQKIEQPLRFDASGSASGEWKIPAEAKLGAYEVSYQRDKNTRFPAGTFRVEAFRVPLLKAAIQAPKEPLVNAKAAPVDLMVSYLSGGGAGGLPVKLRAMTQPRAVTFPNYDDFVFNAGDVKEGIEQQGAFDPEREFADDEASAQDDAEQTRPLAGAVQTIPLQLDAAGAARVTVERLPSITSAHDLLLELEYPDPNGELLVSSQRVPLWPARLHLGLRTEGWAASKDTLRFQVLALDLNGQALAQTAVSVDLFQRKSYSHRKRLIGGFYAYEHVSEVKALSGGCNGRTNAQGLLFCDIKPPAAGEVILRARAKDGAGNLASSSTSVWVAGSEDWWFQVTDHDRIDVIPEKKRYQPGDTARLQVRMPFRAATALVTVEREGVAESYIRALSGKAPVIEIPVRGNHAPNVFISVLVLRGRVGDVQPTALVDLGKPAFKLGIAEIEVGWASHELKVEVLPDKPTYPVRGSAAVTVSVKRANGRLLPKGAEIAFAAVDEGLLELMPNQSWQLLDAMMQRRGMEVATSTAQMQVVGKRHYGRKALPAGGGGGRASARELFDTLLLWQARVSLDDKGRAQVKVPLNDSLTAFRLVAIAHGAAGLFGTGKAQIRTVQDVALFSGLPPLLRTGDQFRAELTLRNTAANALNAKLVGRVEQVIGEARAPLPALPAQSVSLAPGAARVLGWDIAVPQDATALLWEVEAQDSRGKTLDRLKLKQTIVPTHPVRVFQATLTQLDGGYRVAVEAPRDALPGRGGVHLGLRAKLADDLSGVHDYMSRYPYTCIEQISSQAVALRDEVRWNAAMARLPNYLDRDGLARYFASEGLEGSDTLTAYLLAIAAEAGWQIPEASLSRMQRALGAFIEGKIVRYSALPTADLSLRKLAAIDALARYGKANADMLGSISIEPNLWPTSGVIDWLGALQALEQIPQRDDRLREARQILRARLNFQGTTMGFSTERSDTLWWLMISADVNAARALLAVLDTDDWRDDLPRMARGLIGRQLRGHWNTTTANAWGVLALEKFSAKFESEAVAGVTKSSLAAQERTLDWRQTAEGGALEFAWPNGTQELQVTHEGAGKPWLTLQSRAALPLREPFSSGYKIQRRVSALERQSPDAWRRGDVLRVTLDIEAQSDMTWVVVSDPIPAGSSILGSGLGRDSQILSRGERRRGWAWPAYEERSFEAFRAYYEFVPKGKWTLEYTLRLNNPGVFSLPATRVEAMYAPEMLGEVPNETVTVAP